MTKMKIMKPKKDNYYSSTDLIIVRVGAGPNQWNEQALISGILDATN